MKYTEVSCGNRLGIPAETQRSGSGGGRRRKGAGAVFTVRRSRSFADFAATP